MTERSHNTTQKSPFGHSIGRRLAEERTLLLYSQEEFARLGGVQRRAQVRYEKGERVPDALYLARIWVLGVDLLYVVTGERSSHGELLASTGSAEVDRLIEECVRLNVAHIGWFLEASQDTKYAEAVRRDLGDQRDWPRRERAKLIARLLAGRLLAVNPERPAAAVVLDEDGCVGLLKGVAASIKADLARFERERERAA